MRALWLSVGLCLAIALVVEGLYRAQADVRAQFRPQVNDARARATPLEAKVMVETRRSGERLAWRPYVYYRRIPFHGEFVNVDTLGVRRTLGPPPAAAHTILLFGGGQLWGAGLADSLTVPSLLAAALAARGEPGAAVVNLAEREYTFTQQLIELMLDLRAGARPAAVIFCDGPDDVSAALANGRAGLTRNEAARRRDFEVGARLYAWRTDVVSDARALATLARIAAGRFQVLRRLRPARAVTAADSLIAGDIARDQLATMELIDALGRRFHFAPLYVWMPEPHTTTGAYSAVYRRATLALARGAATLTPARFLDLSNLAVAAPDDWGRLPLQGSHAVADTLAGFVRLQLAGMRDHQ